MTGLCAQTVGGNGAPPRLERGERWGSALRLEAGGGNGASSSDPRWEGLFSDGRRGAEPSAQTPGGGGALVSESSQGEGLSTG